MVCRVIAVDASDVEMAETNSPSGRRSSVAPEGLLSPEQVKRGLKALEQKIAEANPAPTLFDVVQTMGMRCHKSIIAQQEAAAAAMLGDPEWGPKIKAIQHAEVKGGMRQQALLTDVADVLRKKCHAPDYSKRVDTDVLTKFLCSLAESALPGFQGALHDVGAGVSGTVELKVAPVKDAGRCGVKVEEYREEKGEENWPHSQFLTDVLRASLIVETAEDMVKVWRSLEKCSAFDVVRLKNKIGECKAPFNLHVNVVYKAAHCEDPIVCEVQIYVRGVYEMQHRQHVAYEVCRATDIGQLLS